MELIEKMARAMCAADKCDPDKQLAVFRDEVRTPAWQLYVDDAQAALTALIEHAGGDGVTEGDKRAATELMVGPKVAGGDGQTYVLRTPSYSEASEAFARHRALAFAAGKAARDREIADAIERGEV